MRTADRRAKIERYGDGYRLLAAALDEIPRPAWKFKPSNRDWSIHEVIIHLADSETNAALRARLLVAEPGRLVMVYDHEKWAIELDYHKQDPDDALQLVKYARQSTYNLLKSLPDSVFEHSVIHSDFDVPYTFDMWLAVYAEHIPAHIEQIMHNYHLWLTR